MRWVQTCGKSRLGLSSFASISIYQCPLGAKLKSSVDVKTCEYCGRAFDFGKSTRKKFCSPRCQRMKNMDSRKRMCGVPGCERFIRARGLCSMHYHRWMRSQGKDSPAWNERRRKNYEKRRARKISNGPIDDFTNLEIFERDEWKCGICGGRVDKDLKWPDPMSPSLDHIVPLSKDGTHTKANVQCSHLRCNESKKDSLPRNLSNLVQAS